MNLFSRVLSVAVAFPPLVVGVLFGVSGCAAFVNGQPLIWGARDVSLSQAVLTRDAGEVLRQLTAGVDVNRRYPVSSDDRPDERHDVTPLEAAIATRELYMVRLVVENGGRVTRENAAELGCFAHAQRIDAIETYLMAHGARAQDCAHVTLPFK